MEKVRVFGEVRLVEGFTRAGVIAAVVLVLVGAASLASWNVISQRSFDAGERADARAWTVVGPPCPSIAAATFSALGPQGKTPFGFRGLQGEMADGGVSCRLIDYVGSRHVSDFPVCQFSSPFVVGVREPTGGDSYFEPGVGRPITVSLRDGRVSCVMGGANPDW